MKKILCTILMLLVGVVTVNADLDDLGDYSHSNLNVSAGYYWVETDDNASRAGEYKSPDKSGSVSLDARGGSDAFHYIIDADFLNEDDYKFDANFDANHAYRLKLRTEKMYHNLDHLIYDPTHPEGRQTATFAGEDRARYSDADIGADYFQKVQISEADIRIKLPDMPAHVSVNYWQIHKEGDKQMRFVDENCAGACHLQSRTRKIDRTTHEISAGIDAHIGKFDAILKHTYREFKDEEPVPTDIFGPHFRLRSSSFTFASQEHSADPESQMNETTLELHSSLAGGVNWAASATVGNRKNNSKATGAAPISSETDYIKGAAEITHVPSAKVSYSFKSRYLDIENENNDTIDPFTNDSNGGNSDSIFVRDNIDLERGLYELTTNFRPNKQTTLKALLQVETIKRSDTGPFDAFSSSSTDTDPDPYWELPDEETITKAKISFFNRPLGNRDLKVNGWYQYKNSSDPAYGTSFANSEQMFLSTVYSPEPNWGVSTTANLLKEKNDDYIREVFDSGNSVVVPIELSRQREQLNLNLGMWFMPADSVNTGINLGFARTAILQDIMFGTAYNSFGTNFIIEAENTEYDQEVQSASANISWKPPESSFKARISGYYLRSLGYYEPDFADSEYIWVSFSPFTIHPPEPATDDGLKEISQYDIDQYGVQVGVDYYFTPDIELVLDYTFDDYEEKYSDAYDGSIQTGMVTLAYRF